METKTLFVPNCLRKRARHTGLSYSGYTIIDYLTLWKVPIYAAFRKLTPQKNQIARIKRAILNAKSTN